MNQWLVLWWWRSVLEGSADVILNSPNLPIYLEEHPELKFVLMAICEM